MADTVQGRPRPRDTFSAKVFGEGLGTFKVMTMAFCVMLVIDMFDSSPDSPLLSPVGVLAFRYSWLAMVILSTFVLMGYYLFIFGRLSGAHLNPAVTVTFALFRGFPWNQVPYYVFAQLVAAILASLIARLFSYGHAEGVFFFGTVPTGSYARSFVVEFWISFLLMFVTCAVATGYKLLTFKAGLIVTATIIINVLVAGPISGASMNPARTLGPAIVYGRYEGLWIYFLGPFLGSFCGALAYNWMCYFAKILSF